MRSRSGVADRYPCITYIPGVAGSQNYAAERIRRIVEKAVGVDIERKEVGNK